MRAINRNRVSGFKHRRLRDEHGAVLRTCECSSGDCVSCAGDCKKVSDRTVSIEGQLSRLCKPCFEDAIDHYGKAALKIVFQELDPDYARPKV